jgi:hypothetical protein
MFIFLNNIPPGMILFAEIVIVGVLASQLFIFLKEEFSTPFYELSRDEVVELIYESGIFDLFCAKKNLEGSDGSLDPTENLCTTLLEATFSKIRELNPYYSSKFEFTQKLKNSFLLDCGILGSLKNPRDLLRDGDPFSSVRRDCESLVHGVEEYCRALVGD